MNALDSLKHLWQGGLMVDLPTDSRDYLLNHGLLGLDGEVLTEDEVLMPCGTIREEWAPVLYPNQRKTHETQTS
jgi:hypothetical protein